VVDEVATSREEFQHRLEGNNYPTTSFSDIQRVLLLLIWGDLVKPQVEQAAKGDRAGDKARGKIDG